MKKYIALLLAAMLVLACVAGCGNNNTDQPGNTDQPNTTDPTPSTPTDPTTPDDSEAKVGPDGREFADEQVYRSVYSSEVTTMNYLISGTTYELVVGANTIDSLVENDSYGNIVPCAAESWKDELETYTVKSTDEDGNPIDVEVQGQKWTFHLRKGQYWYDAAGNQKDPVTAHDYVAAARYMCDSAMDCNNSYLMDGWVINAEELLEYTAAKLVAVEKGAETWSKDEDGDVICDDYVIENGVVYSILWTDDGKVEGYEEYPEVKPEDLGVEALDDYTLVYHLVKPRPYFLTALQFGTYWPAPASLLAELGESYALDNQSMWFNGAYILETFGMRSTSTSSASSRPTTPRLLRWRPSSSCAARSMAAASAPISSTTGCLIPRSLR